MQHEEDLMITKNVKTIKVTSVRTVDFYSSCVSLNRPCFIPGMAKTWPAYEKWSYKNGGTEYLADKLQNHPVRVFYDNDPKIDTESNEGYSFDKDDLKIMQFRKEFLPMMSKMSVGCTMNARSHTMSDKLKDDITLPAFYSDLADLVGIEIN